MKLSTCSLEPKRQSLHISSTSSGRHTCRRSITGSSYCHRAARGPTKIAALDGITAAADGAANLATAGVVSADVKHLLPPFTTASVGALLHDLQGALSSTADASLQAVIEAAAAAPHAAADHLALPGPHLPTDLSSTSIADQALPFVQAAAADPSVLSAMEQASAALDPGIQHLLSTSLLQTNELLQGLTGWVLAKLPAMQYLSPEAYTTISTSLKDLSEAVGTAAQAEAATRTQAAAGGLMLWLQQLVTTLRMPPGAGGGGITAMVALQEALAGAATASAPAEGITTVALMLVALMAAAMPKAGDSSNSSMSDSIGDEGIDVPLRYDPDAIAAYWAKHPMQVMQRNAQVVSQLGGLATTLVADWRLGRWEANIKQRALQARLLLESLGPAYVKIGQVLSTRVDMLPEAYVQELEKLQDNVPVFNTVEAREVLEAGLGCPVDQVFEWLTDEPLASASLGQVYRGKLRPEWGGDEVAVKVQRPGVLEAVSLDIFIMRRAALIFSKLPGMRDEWAGVLDEWAYRFFQEMDYQLEAYNTVTFKRQMAHLEGITVPNIYSDLTSRKIMVMSWVEGEKLSESNSADVKQLCTILLNCYLIQLLETGFLHADPHPGNLMRTPDGKLVILDFGLMTEVSEDQRIALVEFITHLTLEDWVGVANDMVTLGFMPDGLPDGVDVEAEIAPLLQKVTGQLVRGGGIRNGINVFSLTHELDHVAKTYHVVVPAYFTLVLRAFSTIEGIALKVSPDYSIVTECMPYLSRRLLSDNNPRMRAALRHLLYGDGKRIDLERLSRMMQAIGNFSTDACGPSGSSRRSTNASWANPGFPSLEERVKRAPSAASATGSRSSYPSRASGPPPPVDPWGWGAIGAPLGGGFGGLGMLGAMEGGGYIGRGGPVVTDGVKEALKIVFSKDGSYAQELIADELVAAVDAMSRDAVGEALRLVLGSAASLATLRGAEALGPLRSMFLPLPLPAEVLMSLQPAVALSEEDQQTLSTIRLLMQLAQPGGGGAPGLGQLVGSTPRALQVAGELMPLVPELLPGLQSTMELFVRQLVRRLALRLAEDLQPGKTSTATSTYFNGITQQQQQQQEQQQQPMLSYSYTSFSPSGGYGTGSNRSRDSAGTFSQGHHVKGAKPPGGYVTPKQGKGTNAWSSTNSRSKGNTSTGNASPWV